MILILISDFSNQMRSTGKIIVTYYLYVKISKNKTCVNCNTTYFAYSDLFWPDLDLS